MLYPTSTENTTGNKTPQTISWSSNVRNTCEANLVLDLSFYLFRSLHSPSLRGSFYLKHALRMDFIPTHFIKVLSALSVSNNNHSPVRPPFRAQ